MTDAPRYRDVTQVTVAAKVSLGVYMAAVAGLLVSMWLRIDVLQRIAQGEVVSEARDTAAISRFLLAYFANLVVYLVTAVMFLRWTYVSCQYARVLGARRMRFSPGWAVGWYFVPIAALWMPYLALAETFQASHPKFRDDWQRAPCPEILPLWWILWIGSFFARRVGDYVASTAQTQDEILTASWIGLLTTVPNLALGLVAILVVSTLHRWQGEKRQRLRGPDPKEGHAPGGTP